MVVVRTLVTISALHEQRPRRMSGKWRHGCRLTGWVSVASGRAGRRVFGTWGNLRVPTLTRKRWPTEAFLQSGRQIWSIMSRWWHLKTSRQSVQFRARTTRNLPQEPPGLVTKPTRPRPSGHGCRSAGGSSKAYRVSGKSDADLIEVTRCARTRRSLAALAPEGHSLAPVPLIRITYYETDRIRGT